MPNLQLRAHPRLPTYSSGGRTRLLAYSLRVARGSQPTAWGSHAVPNPQLGGRARFPTFSSGAARGSQPTARSTTRGSQPTARGAARGSQPTARGPHATPSLQPEGRTRLPTHSLGVARGSQPTARGPHAVPNLQLGGRTRLPTVVKNRMGIEWDSRIAQWPERLAQDRKILGSSPNPPECRCETLVIT